MSRWRDRTKSNVVFRTMAALAFLFAACGTDDGDTVRAQDGAEVSRYQPPGIISRPVVDEAGTTWIASRDESSRTVLAAIPRDRPTLEVSLAGTLFAESGGPSVSVAPGGDGVVVASVRCPDSVARDCIEAGPTVALSGFIISEDEIAPTAISWEREVPPDNAAGPALVGRTGDSIIYWLALEGLLVTVSRETVTDLSTPPGATQPCVVRDRVITLADPLSDPPVAPAFGTENDITFSPYEVAIQAFDDGAWTLQPDSKRTVGSPDGYPEARCTDGGIELSTPGQQFDSVPASTVWDGSRWIELEGGRNLAWEYTNTDTYEGLVGVLEGAVVQVDGVTGEIELSRQLPEGYSRVWQVGEPGSQPNDAVGPPGGAVAIGGPSSDPVAVACPDGPLIDEVVCEVFA